MLSIAGAVSACASPGLSREPAQSAQRCYRDDFGGRRASLESLSGGELSEIALSCRTLAGDASRPRRETLYANFYAGKAWRLSGQAESRPMADPVWANAETALRDVVDFNGPPPGARSSAADLRFALTRIEAELELAQVLRTQNRKDDAVRRARKAIADYEAYIANSAITTLKEEANAGRVNASIALAEIHRMTPADNLAALVALQVFIDRNLDRHPRAADARADIIATANTLGAAQLTESTPEALRNATNYFTLALDAALAAKRVNPALDISETYINLGRVNMAAAGRIGPEVAGGCDPVTGDTTSIRQALELFNNAPASPLAIQYRGCAQMALGDLTAAVQSFRQAAAANGNTAVTQLALARGLYRAATIGVGNTAANWQDARAAYRSALQIMADPARNVDPEARARVHVELAEVDLEYVFRTNFTTPSKASVIDEAFASLQRATQLAPNRGDAFLRLGLMQLGEGVFAPKRDLEGPNGARANIARALKLASGADQRALRAESYFLLSRLEVQKLRTGGRADERAAISNGDQAAELGDEVRGPIYYAQACEARLLFNRVAGDGSRFCRADEARDQANFPAALLREGLYFLSRGSNARARPEQAAAWDAAYSAFDRGAAGIPDFGRDPVSAELRAKLLAGKGLAMRCSGLTKVGADIINSIPSDLRETARIYFDTYGLPRCT
ncbi:MAG: hypothetical protein NW200_12550 [Hyphomonadaceae bacterium]|nr:hypothetical protein [Hyphomonadaceae bacterium]